jgi:hypothetical protein
LPLRAITSAERPESAEQRLVAAKRERHQRRARLDHLEPKLRARS